MPSRAGEVRRRFETLLVPANQEGGLSEGVVTRAQNTSGEVFALKVLRSPSLSHDRGDTTPDTEALRLVESSRELAFAEEYRSMLAVSFLRGFPRVYGFGLAAGSRDGHDEERPAIIMEWVEGLTLRETTTLLPARIYADESARPRRSILPETVAALGTAILDILLSAGELDCSFLHRDLSPRNIIVRTSSMSIAEQIASSSFDLRIVDLGSSSVLRDGEQGTTLTHDIWRFGTVEYAAPEMLTRDVPEVSRLRHSETVDTYAICSILYEMVCDQTPFGLARRPDASPYLTKMRECPEVPTWLDGNARGLAELLVRGLNADQKRRYTTTSLREALATWPEDASRADAPSRHGKRRSLFSALASAAAEWARERRMDG